MKRFLDVLLGILILVLTSPLLAAVSLFVLLADGRPVIFSQDRVGKNNELFRIRKFRTMKNGTANVAKKDLKDYKARLIPGGNLLRRTSLDELPQLLNILKGEMSFVGPRPLIPEETEIRKMREEAGVYAVRPGVTGWAQVNGRDFISDEEKTALDKEYVEKCGFKMDLKILFKTVVVVLTHKDISQKTK